MLFWILNSQQKKPASKFSMWANASLKAQNSLSANERPLRLRVCRKGMCFFCSVSHCDWKRICFLLHWVAMGRATATDVHMRGSTSFNLSQQNDYKLIKCKQFSQCIFIHSHLYVDDGFFRLVLFSLHSFPFSLSFSLALFYSLNVSLSFTWYSCAAYFFRVFFFYIVINTRFLFDGMVNEITEHF